MNLLLAQGRRADDLLAEVADGVSFDRDHLPEAGGQRAAALDELPLQDRHSARDGFHRLEQRVQDRLLQAPVVILLVVMLLGHSY